MDSGELYVHQMTGMQVTDVAEVVASNQEIVELGIRLSDKFHEKAIREEDARRTARPGDRYVGAPTFAE